MRPPTIVLFALAFAGCSKTEPPPAPSATPSASAAPRSHPNECRDVWRIISTANKSIAEASAPDAGDWSYRAIVRACEEASLALRGIETTSAPMQSKLLIYANVFRDMSKAAAEAEVAVRRGDQTAEGKALKEFVSAEDDLVRHVGEVREMCGAQAPSGSASAAP